MTISESLEFTLRAVVTGPHPEIDEHQKWVEETAALVDWPVRIEVGLSKTQMLMAPGYGSFDVIARITAQDGTEAALIMLGLCDPRPEPLDEVQPISIDHMEITMPYEISEEP